MSKLHSKAPVPEQMLVVQVQRQSSVPFHTGRQPGFVYEQPHPQSRPGKTGRFTQYRSRSAAFPHIRYPGICFATRSELIETVFQTEFSGGNWSHSAPGAGKSASWPPTVPTWALISGVETVAGDSIQCPFHNWKYGADGVCNHIPGTNSIPAFARQATYPAEERNGYIFFFNGVEALFPLPFFFDASPE